MAASGGTIIPQANLQSESTQTCLQCYRKTVAPLVLKCQHFICLNCLKEQLMLTKGGLYSEYKCKVCGLFTDLSHLSKVFIDNKAFNIFETDTDTRDDEKVKTANRHSTFNSSMKLKPKSPSKKKIVVTTTNVANLADKAEELISALQVNRKVSGEEHNPSYKEIFKSQYMDPIDYSKCIQHQRELIFMDRESSDFYCVDCISDVNVKLNKDRLIKIKKENNIIKEKSKQAVTSLVALQNRIEANLRIIHEKITITKSMTKEVKHLIKSQFNFIYNEMKNLEAKYEEMILQVLVEEEKLDKKLQTKNLRMLGIVSGVQKNFNQLESPGDLVSNIARWRRVSKEYDMNAVLNKEINSTIDTKIQ